jgi:hypothetical protein
MRTLVGWSLIAVWAVLGPAYALWKVASSVPSDCCYGTAIPAGIDTILVALITLPVAIVGLWLVNQDKESTPTLALSVIGASLLAGPIAVGFIVGM